MINYIDYDIEKYQVMKRILDFLVTQNKDDEGFEITDQDVWDEARTSSIIPIFENILMEKTCSAIEQRIDWLYNAGNENDYNLSIKFSFYINAHDTHISINGSEIYGLADFKQALAVNGVSL